MIWSILAILGLILTALAFLALLLRSRRKHWGQLGDSVAFRMQLAEWESFVLARDGTLRGVKRFANRVRFLTADEKSDDMISKLVSLGALEEVGCIDSSWNKFDFAQWKQGELWTAVKLDLTEQSIAKVEQFLEKTSAEHWRRYRALATGNWSQIGGQDDDEKSRALHDRL